MAFDKGRCLRVFTVIANLAGGLAIPARWWVDSTGAAAVSVTVIASDLWTRVPQLF